MRKAVVTYFLFLFLASFSQKINHTDFRFRKIPSSSELPSNAVKSILQDKKGFMWFGTAAGLVRFDGYSYKLFVDSSKFSDQSIVCIAEDKKGRIWTGSRGNGISVLDPVTEKFKRYVSTKKDTNSLDYNDVTAICVDKTGDVWVGTRAGLNKYLSESDNFRRYDSVKLCPNTIFGLYCGQNNKLWICSHYSGFNSFDIKTGKFSQYKRSDDHTSWYTAMSVAEDTVKKIMYVSSREGFGIFSQEKQKFIKWHSHDPLNENSISGNDLFASKVILDRNNRVWIGSWHDGLNVFLPESEKFIRLKHIKNLNSSISNNTIRAVFEDAQGNIWLGTENGICVYSPNQSSFRVYEAISGNPGTLNSNAVTAVYEDINHRIWVGTESDGVNVMDFKTNEMKSFKNSVNNKNSLQCDQVSAICEDNENNIWIATVYGKPASLYNVKTEKMNINPAGSIEFALLKDHQGMIWYGGHGFRAYDAVNKRNIAADSACNDSIKRYHRYNCAIFQDSENNMWFGSSEYGLSSYNVASKKFNNYLFDTANYYSLSHNTITSLGEDSRKNLWIGTYYGLNCFDKKTGKFKKYFTSDGLPDNIIYGILPDENGILWIGTTKGLCRFDPLKNEFRNYDVSDGIPSNDFTGACFKSTDGKFYFGTLGGLLAFYPREVHTNEHKPEIALTGLSVLNKSWPMPKAITYCDRLDLTYREYFFTIEFAALDFAAPQKNKYAYKLEGFNKEWVYTGNKREITFTNLDPGSYILKVKACNNHGVWSAEKELLNITISPPWWKTTWFRILASILVTILLYLIYLMRTRSLREAKKLLEKTVQERTSEILTQKEIIEEKQKEIIDSIKYAKRIQQSLFPTEKYFQKNIKNKA